jgi:hypothetical protein
MNKSCYDEQHRYWLEDHRRVMLEIELSKWQEYLPGQYKRLVYGKWQYGSIFDVLRDA